MASLFFFFFLLSLSVASAGESPFTPKSALLRYWNTQITSKSPKPTFLISKASPLTAVDAAAFAKLADKNAIADHLQSFCAAADLLCFPDLAQSSDQHLNDADFVKYMNRNFSSYGDGKHGGADGFSNYSEGDNVVIDDFRRYSRNSGGHNDRFETYGTESNVADQSFNSYASGAGGGIGEFRNYNREVNVPHLKFNNYGFHGDGRVQSFSAYTEDTNSGNETFTSYGRDGKNLQNVFTSYGGESNVIGSRFNGYGEAAAATADRFTNYAIDGNNPENIFNSYGAGVNGGTETFANYREKSNVGVDEFKSYAKNSISDEVNFLNYGRSFNEGTDKFSGYGQGATGETVGFKVYGVNNTFKDYAKNDSASFSSYVTRAEAAAAMEVSGRTVNKWVEPGKFFRESMLKKGTLMPMPDIKDKMPKRSFLPRTITSKLPFATDKLSLLKKTFHAANGSAIEAMLSQTLSECERDPSPGETKQCVVSIEDMIDFATSVLGRNIVVRTTDNVSGSKQEILIGHVRGINGGKTTKAVSCHQSLYPYLVYYCHSVPEVRVYEADLLDPTSKLKINHGIAICHIDTSSWSARHGAFLALGYGPGKIEVCHWIFENDMNWTRSD